MGELDGAADGAADGKGKAQLDEFGRKQRPPSPTEAEKLQVAMRGVCTLCAMRGEGYGGRLLLDG